MFRKPRRCRALVCLAVAGALAITAAAFAANGVGFPDRSGDGRQGPDIVQVYASSDDVGSISVRLDVPGRTMLAEHEAVLILIDVDQNPDTGSGYFGTEYLLELGADGALRAFHSDGNEFAAITPPASATATFAGGAATFSFTAADLGISTGFNVLAVSLDGSRHFADPAPDARAYNYQLVAGAQPPPLGADRRAPFVLAYKSKGVHGKSGSVDFDVFEGRGEAAETVTIYRKKKVLASSRFGTRVFSPFFRYRVGLRIATKDRGTLRFCVTAVDRAGNKSKPGCASLVIR